MDAPEVDVKFQKVQGKSGAFEKHLTCVLSPCHASMQGEPLLQVEESLKKLNCRRFCNYWHTRLSGVNVVRN